MEATKDDMCLTLFMTFQSHNIKHIILIKENYTYYLLTLLILRLVFFTINNLNIHILFCEYQKGLSHTECTVLMMALDQTKPCFEHTYFESLWG